MAFKRTTLGLALLALLAFSATADAARELNWWKSWKSQRPTLVSVASEVDILETLVSAIGAAPKILEAASDPDTAVTVFAPTNDAFKDWLEMMGMSVEELVADTQTLTDVLSYHILPAVVESDDIPVGTIMSPTLLPTTEVEVEKLPDGTILVGSNDAKVELADVKAGKSVVHVIDKVLDLPPYDTLASKAMSYPVLSLLVEAVGKVPAVLAAARDPHTEVTLLAPSNDAFAALLDSNPEWESLDDIPEQELMEVLLYHIVPTVFTSDAADAEPLTLDTALSGRTLDVQLDGNTVKINPSTDNAQVLLPDVTAGLSIVHVIDKVLLPPPKPTIAGVANEAGLSLLVEAVAAAPQILEAATNPDTAVTVLAPTNEAFVKALTDLQLTKEDLLSNTELLTEILAYHIIPHPVESSRFGGRKTIANTLLHGSYLTIQRVAREVRIYTGLLWHGNIGNDAAKVVIPDVPAGHSIVHVIDQVLVPPSGPWNHVIRWLNSIFG